MDRNTKDEMKRAIMFQLYMLKGVCKTKISRHKNLNLRRKIFFKEIKLFFMTIDLDFKPQFPNENIAYECEHILRQAQAKVDIYERRLKVASNSEDRKKLSLDQSDIDKMEYELSQARKEIKRYKKASDEFKRLFDMQRKLQGLRK